LSVQSCTYGGTRFRSGGVLVLGLEDTSESSKGATRAQSV